MRVPAENTEAGTDVMVLEVTVDEPMALVVVDVGTSVIDRTPVGTARFDDLEPGETYTARFTRAGEILGAIDCYAQLKRAEF